MYKRQTNRFFGVLAATLLVVGHAAAQEQLGSAFTYQGGLKLSGQAVNGTADFEFTLWGAATDGNMIGSVWPVNDVNVVDGLFTALLDFGVEPYTTNEARWLEIAVRSPSGKGNFTTLDPRQRLTPAPFSLATRGINVDANGNVGVGTNPTSTLDVGGDLLIRDPVDFNRHSMAVDPPKSMIVDGANNGGAIYLGAYGDDPTAAIEASWGGALFPQVGIGVTRGGTRANILMDFEGRTRIRNGNADILVAEGSGNVGIGTAPAAKLHVGGVPGVDGIMFPDGTLQITASQGGEGCPCPFNVPVRAFKVFAVPAHKTERQTALTAPADRSLYVTGVNISHLPNADFGFVRILIDGEVVLEFVLDVTHRTITHGPAAGALRFSPTPIRML